MACGPGAAVRLLSAEVVTTSRPDGDLGPGPVSAKPSAELERRRRAVVDRPWSWLRQVHGSTVVVVDSPGAGAGRVGDAMVSSEAGACLAVFSADCATLALASPEGVIGVAHAGWRGLVAGVIEAALSAMSEQGASEVHALVGPCIRPGCYEFSPAHLDLVAARYGDGVRSLASSGRPALDVMAAVACALERGGAELDGSDPACTACSGRHYSHRGGRDGARQATVIWRPPQG